MKYIIALFWIFDIKVITRVFHLKKNIKKIHVRAIKCKKHFCIKNYVLKMRCLQPKSRANGYPLRKNAVILCKPNLECAFERAGPFKTKKFRNRVFFLYTLVSQLCLQ